MDNKTKFENLQNVIQLGCDLVVDTFKKLTNLKKETSKQKSVFENGSEPNWQEAELHVDLLCDYIHRNLRSLESAKDEFKQRERNTKLYSIKKWQTDGLVNNNINDVLELSIQEKKPKKKFNLSLIDNGDVPIKTEIEQNFDENIENSSEHNSYHVYSNENNNFNMLNTLMNIKQSPSDEIDIEEHEISIKKETDNFSETSTIKLSHLDILENIKQEKTEDSVCEKENSVSPEDFENTTTVSDDIDATHTFSGNDVNSNSSSLKRFNALCDLLYDSQGSFSSDNTEMDSSEENYKIVDKVNKDITANMSKPCSVLLEKLFDVDKTKEKKTVQPEEIENQLIERLTNLENIENISKRDKDKKLEEYEQRKQQSLSSRSSTSSFVSPSDDENDSLSNGSFKEISSNENLESLPSSENDENSSGTDSSTTKCKPSKTKDYAQENPKPVCKKDKLLTLNLTFKETDDEDSMKDFKERKKTGVENNGANGGVDVKMKGEEDDLVISSDSSTEDSDCEITTTKENKNSEVDAHSKGRKNIKQVLGDDVLEETTKQANLEEEQRKARLSMKQKTLENVLSQTEFDQNEVGIVLDVDEETKKPILYVRSCLVKTLKAHQIKGIKFMWSVCYESVKRLKEDNGTGCILAHYMGLGKTRQIVILSYTLLANEITNVKHVLIVCPLSTVYGWMTEYENTLKSVQHGASKINVFCIRDQDASKKISEIFEWYNKGGVLLMGYERFQQYTKSNFQYLSEVDKIFLMKALINPGPDLVVCDEGHMLKNGKTLRCKSLQQITTKRRIILTGTPLQNNLEEYYHMVNFVKPNLLGSKTEYSNRFKNPIINGQYEDSDPADIRLMKNRSHVLHKKLESTVQRFEASELTMYLPNKVDYILFITLTPLQIKLYQKYLDLFCGSSRSRTLFIDYFNLQYIWTHPALLYSNWKNAKTKMKTYDEDYVRELDPDSLRLSQPESPNQWFHEDCPSDVMSNIEYGPKIQILFSILEECELIGDKLLVFSSSMLELDLIEFFFKQHGTRKTGPWKHKVDYLRMDGFVSPRVRTQYCNTFNRNDNKIKVFLMSHKVGGLGLNLVAANRVVLMDVSWNPSYDIQSIYRIYRFGQTKTCFIYRLVSMGTMEEVVYGRAITKLAIAGRVVDEQQIMRHFKSNDLQTMYQLNAKYGLRPKLHSPFDKLLAKLLHSYNHLYKYQEHQTLLENQLHEELTEYDQRLAMEEFEKSLEMERLGKLPLLQNHGPPNETNHMINPNQNLEIPTSFNNAFNHFISPGQNYTPNNMSRRFLPPNRRPLLNLQTDQLNQTPGEVNPNVAHYQNMNLNRSISDKSIQDMINAQITSGFKMLNPPSLNNNSNYSAPMNLSTSVPSIANYNVPVTSSNFGTNQLNLNQSPVTNAKHTNVNSNPSNSNIMNQQNIQTNHQLSTEPNNQISPTICNVTKSLYFGNKPHNNEKENIGAECPSLIKISNDTNAQNFVNTKPLNPIQNQSTTQNPTTNQVNTKSLNSRIRLDTELQNINSIQSQSNSKKFTDNNMQNTLNNKDINAKPSLQSSVPVPCQPTSKTFQPNSNNAASISSNNLTNTKPSMKATGVWLTKLDNQYTQDTPHTTVSSNYSTIQNQPSTSKRTIIQQLPLGTNNLIESNYSTIQIQQTTPKQLTNQQKSSNVQIPSKQYQPLNVNMAQVAQPCSKLSNSIVNSVKPLDVNNLKTAQFFTPQSQPINSQQSANFVHQLNPNYLLVPSIGGQQSTSNSQISSTFNQPMQANNKQVVQPNRRSSYNSMVQSQPSSSSSSQISCRQKPPPLPTKKLVPIRPRNEPSNNSTIQSQSSTSKSTSKSQISSTFNQSMKVNNEQVVQPNSRPSYNPIMQSQPLTQKTIISQQSSSSSQISSNHNPPLTTKEVQATKPRYRPLDNPTMQMQPSTPKSFGSEQSTSNSSISSTFDQPIKTNNKQVVQPNRRSIYNSMVQSQSSTPKTNITQKSSSSSQISSKHIPTTKKFQHIKPRPESSNNSTVQNLSTPKPNQNSFSKPPISSKWTGSNIVQTVSAKKRPSNVSTIQSEPSTSKHNLPLTTKKLQAIKPKTIISNNSIKQNQPSNSPLYSKYNESLNLNSTVVVPAKRRHMSRSSSSSSSSSQTSSEQCILPSQTTQKINNSQINKSKNRTRKVTLKQLDFRKQQDENKVQTLQSSQGLKRPGSPTLTSEKIKISRTISQNDASLFPSASQNQPVNNSSATYLMPSTSISIQNNEQNTSTNTARTSNTHNGPRVLNSSIKLTNSIKVRKVSEINEKDDVIENINQMIQDLENKNDESQEQSTEIHSNKRETNSFVDLTGTNNKKYQEIKLRVINVNSNKMRNNVLNQLRG